MAIFRVLISGTCYAQLNQNRFYCRSDVENDSPFDIAQIVKANWINQVRVPLTNQTIFQSIQVTKLGGLTLESHTEPISITGAQGGNDQMVPFTCWVLKFETGLGGRKFRGRCYLGPVQAGFFTFGVLNGQGILHWNETLLNLNAAWTNDDSRLRMVIHGEGEAHDTSVIQISLRSTMGVQRRRNIGVGA